MIVRLSLVYVIGRYGASAVTLIAISLYTRLASPSDYGFYALVMALVTALYATFGQWLRQVLLRFAVQCENGDSALPSAILQSFALIAVIIGVFLLLLSTQLEGEIGRAIIMAAPLLAAMGFFELAIAWLQLHLKSSFYVGMSLLRTVSAAGLGLLALYVGYGAFGLITATTFAYLIAATPVFVATHFGLGNARAALPTLRPMVRFGLPLAASASLGAALGLADRAIIASLISTEAAGLYAAPYDLANRTLQVLMLAINLAGTPLILRAFEENDLKKTKQFLIRQWLLLLMAALPVTLAMISMPLGISRILLGVRFQDSGASLMPLVAAATFLQGLESFYFGLAFTLKKSPLRQTGVLFLATVLNIGLTFWLVPIFGIIGGAWATFLSAIIGIIGSAWLGRSLHPLPFARREIRSLFAAGCIMGFYLFWRSPATPLMAVLDGLVGTGLYLIVLIVLNFCSFRHTVTRFIRARFLALGSAGEI